MLLRKLVGKVTLHQEGADLVAEVRGNLIGILGERDLCGDYGAGRGISYLPHWPSSTWRFRGPWTTAAR